MKEANKSVFLVDTQQNQETLINLLAEATAKVEELLNQSFSASNLIDLQSAFGTGVNGDRFIEDWQNKEYFFPEIELVSRSQINNANGAFATGLFHSKK